MVGTDVSIRALEEGYYYQLKRADRLEEELNKSVADNERLKRELSECHEALKQLRMKTMDT